MNKEIIEKLKKLAAQETIEERNPKWLACDSGNYDDTFNRGIDDGRIWLAREIIAELKLDQTK